MRARKNVTNLSIREIIDKNEKLFVAGVASRGKKKEENLIDWSKLFFLKFRVFCISEEPSSGGFLCFNERSVLTHFGKRLCAALKD